MVEKPPEKRQMEMSGVSIDSRGSVVNIIDNFLSSYKILNL
jgi:hypothetical protein